MGQPLYEKYRPRCWADVVGQEHTVRKLRRMADAGRIAGHVFWIEGPSGTGKTVLARIIAREVADPLNIVEYDATALRSEDLDDVRDMVRYTAIGRLKGHAIIINEAHGMRQDIVRRLLVSLEPIPAHSAFVFTTTDEGQEDFESRQDSQALLSRCIRIELAGFGNGRAFAEYAARIADAEGLGGAPVERYIEFLVAHHHNVRALLQAIEAGDFWDGVQAAPAPAPAAAPEPAVEQVVAPAPQAEPEPEPAPEPDPVVMAAAAALALLDARPARVRFADDEDVPAYGEAA